MNKECCICGKEAKKVFKNRFYCVTCLPSNFGKDIKEETKVKPELVQKIVEKMSCSGLYIWYDTVYKELLKRGDKVIQTK